MKQFNRIAVTTVLAVLTAFFSYIAYFYINEYRPQKLETVSYSPNVICDIPDTISLISWNIGYCGYNSSMDFFMDGGDGVRDSEETTIENLKGVISFLREYRNVDFILLQEVDIKSKRSYRMNLLDSIAKELSTDKYYTTNFRCSHVPIPLYDPIGEVESGLAVLTKHKPIRVLRHQLPGEFPFVERIFNLKRALLEMQFVTSRNDTVNIFNLHNSAYDKGGELRKNELQFIDSLLQKRRRSVFAGDWNSNPPGYNASKEEKENEYFAPVSLDSTTLSGCLYAVADSGHTMRYLNEPYKKGRTTESLLDFAVVTSPVEPIETKIIDLGFRNSDHNPVFYRFKIR